MKKIQFSTFALLSVSIFFFPIRVATAQYANANSMVRLVYFLPSDRPARPDRVAALRQLIKDTQTFFADEMERHGFDRKTFTIETDRTGEPLVHHVNGRFNDAYYCQQTVNKVWEELNNAFDNPQRIYFVAIDISIEILDGSCGGAKGYYEQRGKGFLIPASGHCFKLPIAAHELGHAFALEHDFRDNAYIMSYGSNPNSISKCAAEWLNAHGFFNNTSAQVNRDARIQMLAPTAAPPNGIRLRFEVNDVDRLHLAQLYLKPTLGDPTRDFKLDGCHLLDAESDTIEFVTSELVDPSQNEVTLQVIDKHGGMKRQTFPINIAHLLPPQKVVSIPDPNLAAAIRAAFGLAPRDAITDQAMYTLTWLNAWDRKITNIEGLKYATRLTGLDLGANRIKNYNQLAQLPKLRRLHLWNNNIKNLSELPQLPKLEFLDLNWNEIRDVGPLAGFINLKELWLQGNHLMDTSTLFQLHNGTFPSDEKVEITEERDNNGRAYTLLTFQSLDLKVRINPDVTVYRSLNAVQNARQTVTTTNMLVQEAVHPPMYWINTDTGTLHRLVGSKVENLAPSVKNATSLAVDVVNEKLYWTEQTGKNRGKIKRANLNGSNVQVIATLRDNAPNSIAVDTMRSMLYWTSSRDLIRRANLNGKQIRNLVQNLDSPEHIVVDVARAKLYWTETSGRIRRANLNGKRIQNIASDLDSISGIAISGNKLYWAEITGEGSGKIGRANLNGSNLRTLARLQSVPLNVAIDSVSKKLYWTDAGGNIRRANLNGRKIQNVVSGLTSPADLALGSSSEATAAPANSSLASSEIPTPDATSLFANYPNPFNPETWIPYQLAKPADVTLTIYAVDGTLIRTLVLAHQPAGPYHSKNRAACWDGRNAVGEPVASGIYFYTLTAGDFSATRKMLIRK